MTDIYTIQAALESLSMLQAFKNDPASIIDSDTIGDIRDMIFVRLLGGEEEHEE